MSRPTDERKTERERLRELARTADTEDERRGAVRRLAALDRERNRDTYDELANERARRVTVTPPRSAGRRRPSASGA